MHILGGSQPMNLIVFMTFWDKISYNLARDYTKSSKSKLMGDQDRFYSYYVAIGPVGEIMGVRQPQSSLSASL